MNLLLVTGTRRELTEAGERFVISKALPHGPPIHLTLHGACPTGVDQCVDSYCGAEGVVVVGVPANWVTDERAAGPRRNRAMVEVCSALSRIRWHVRVAAFPYGKSPGTRGCIKLAEAAGFPVEVFELSEEHVK